MSSYRLEIERAPEEPPGGGKPDEVAAAGRGADAGKQPELPAAAEARLEQVEGLTLREIETRIEHARDHDREARVARVYLDLPDGPMLLNERRLTKLGSLD